MQNGEEGVQIVCKIAYAINGRPHTQSEFRPDTMRRNMDEAVGGKHYKIMSLTEACRAVVSIIAQGQIVA